MVDSCSVHNPATPNSEQLKDIVRVAAYHRRDFELALVRFNPCEHNSVRHSILRPFDGEPTSNLGDLECLPTELLLKICLLLDVLILFRFRQVNRSARRLVGVSWEYNAVVTNALGALCAVIRTKLGNYVTVPQMYTTLCTKDCRQCGKFAGLTFLPSFTRCCFECLQTASRFRMMPLSVAESRLGKSLKTKRLTIPILHTVPGIYSMEETSRTRRIRIVAEKHVLDELMRTRGEQSEHGLLASPSVLEKTPSILRFMAASAMPWLDAKRSGCRQGISCKGCQIAIETEASTDYGARDRVHSEDSFWKHFQICKQAQELWNSSLGGTIAVEEPEATKRGGFLGERDIVMSYKRS